MPRRLKAPEGHKQCSVCRTIKVLDDFHRHKIGSQGRAAVCKVCACAKSAAYFKSGKGMDMVRKNARRPNGRTSQLLRSIKLRTKKAGMEFDLTRDWILSRVERGRCEATGLTFVLTGDEERGRLRSPWSPSIDRLDTTRGYTQDNCRMVVLAFNTARSDWGDGVVMKMARALLGLPHEYTAAISSGRSELRAVH